MRIRVIDKKTGMTGTLPEEEFNSKKYTKVVDKPTTPKPTLLGDIPQIGGPSNLIAQAEEQKKKADADSALQQKIFQKAVVPAGQIIGGIVGGVPGAGVGGALGESLRQFQASEQANLGNIVKEGVIGAGTQYVGGKVGELLTKGKSGAKVAETVVKQPNKIQKAGQTIQEVSSGINPGSKVKGVGRAVAKAEVDGILKGYGLYKPGITASDDVASLYNAALEDMKTAVSASIETPETTGIISTIKNKIIKSIPNLSKGEKAVANLYGEKIASATNMAQLDAIDAELRGIMSTMTPKITREKRLYQGIQNTIREYISTKVPQYKDSFGVMRDMQKVAPAVGLSAQAVEAGVKLPIVGKFPGSNIVLDKAQALGVGAGKIVEKIGGGLPNIPGFNLPPATAGLVAPAMQVGLGSMRSSPTGLPQPTETGTLPDIGQNQPELKTNYLTGYSPEELYQAYLSATQVGDKKAAAQLRQMFTDETAYQKSTATTKGTAAEEAQKKVSSMIDMAIQDVESGKVRTGVIAGPLESFKANFNMADQPTLDFQKLSAIIKADIVKAKAGTALTPTEEALLNQYVPQVNDSTQNVKTKLKMLQETSTLILDKYRSQNTLPNIPQ